MQVNPQTPTSDTRYTFFGLPVIECPHALALISLVPKEWRCLLCEQEAAQDVK